MTIIYAGEQKNERVVEQILDTDMWKCVWRYRQLSDRVLLGETKSEAIQYGDHSGICKHVRKKRRRNR